MEAALIGNEERGETTISTNPADRSASSIVTSESSHSSAIVTAKPRPLRRKSRAYSKGALISHLTIISLIVGMVLLSYQAPTGVVLNSAQTNQEKSIEAPTVDQVSSAALASVAAQ